MPPPAVTPPNIPKVSCAEPHSSSFASLHGLIETAADIFEDERSPLPWRYAAKKLLHQLFRARMALSAGATGVANACLSGAASEFSATVARLEQQNAESN